MHRMYNPTPGEATMPTAFRNPRRQFGALALATALALAPLAPAQAHGGGSSTLSQLSLLPIAVVVAAPSVLLSGVATLTVVSVEAAAQGSVWVLERGSDGARIALRLAGGASVLVGTAVVVTTVSAGAVLSVAGQAIAFVPNQVGKALMHHERVTR